LSKFVLWNKELQRKVIYVFLLNLVLDDLDVKVSQNFGFYTAIVLWLKFVSIFEINCYL